LFQKYKPIPNASDIESFSYLFKGMRRQPLSWIQKR